MSLKDRVRKTSSGVYDQEGDKDNDVGGGSKEIVPENQLTRVHHTVSKVEFNFLKPGETQSTITHDPDSRVIIFHRKQALSNESRGERDAHTSI